ncbi:MULTISPECIES: urea transporter [Vibrio]|uniref:Urea transporter n=3 Tax=Vibrio cyclitrophicus TaxID=47951 RepID=A0A7Z1MJL3_9VIBR|nr:MULTISPECIES: urea transporter [Vibrio]ERM57298.1 Eukaryotic-type low-affinity urea transporter [Vibrio cyclitrophicus FF75]MBE8556494.1 urea transporter [Vibrio sp. OPT24]OBS92426.1 urea transporter [Vibrio cyclitrophicus]OBT02800.1 urea transporter [Vibrio cyclitrophicus]OBT23350.1 urea transporter [Vibrio cyclitrophicus]
MMTMNKDTLPLKGLLNGIGQVYFTPSVMTSLLLLLAISIESLALACLTLLGASCSYALVFYIFTFSNTNKSADNISSGMYALNGALIGLFIGNFFGVTPLLVLVTVFGALLTVPIANIVFSFKKYRAYTSAFVLTSWLIYVIQSTLDLSAFATPTSVFVPIISIEQGSWFNLSAVVIPLLKGISQVSFIENALSGLVILIAIALNNLKHALWVVASVVLSTAFSHIIGASGALIEQGLYGYNAILSTLALVLYTRIPWPLILLGILLSSLITLGFHELSLLPLTAPFILSTWVIVYLTTHFQKRVKG